MARQPVCKTGAAAPQVGSISTPGTKNLVVVRGHNGSLQLRCGARNAWFYRGTRTLTGIRDRWGQCQYMTAPEVMKKLGLKNLLKEPYDYVVFDGDKHGFFGPVSVQDVLACMKQCTYLPTLPIGLLQAVARMTKEKKE